MGGQGVAGSPAQGGATQITANVKSHSEEIEVRAQLDPMQLR
jgi:hypothetical protein